MEESIPNFPISFLEYGAEEIMVEIIPNFSHPLFRFISYHIGPFHSGLPVDVPLWFAITLKKRGKCRIRTPDWLQVTNLEKLVREEGSEQQRILSNLPFQFHELANLFLIYCAEDMEQPERVRALVQDLANIRDDRIRLGIRSTAELVQSDSSVVSAALYNVASMEIFATRQFFLGAMDAFLWLKPPKEDDYLFGTEDHDLRETTASVPPPANNSNRPANAGNRLRRHRK